MNYMGWQIRDMNRDFKDNVLLALEYFQKKYGQAPNIVEYSMDVKPCPLLEKVAFTPIQVPANILLIGVQDEKI